MKRIHNVCINLHGLLCFMAHCWFVAVAIVERCETRSKQGQKGFKSCCRTDVSRKCSRTNTEKANQLLRVFIKLSIEFTKTSDCHKHRHSSFDFCLQILIYAKTVFVSPLIFGLSNLLNFAWGRNKKKKINVSQFNILNRCV